MFPYCVACHELGKESIHEVFCKDCQQHFERAGRLPPLELRGGGRLIKVHSLMDFDVVRPLILSAKIGCDVGALRGLGQFFRRHIKEQAQEINFKSIDYISSVPQSSYSCLRGRFDLADYFCECLKLDYRVPILPLRTPFLWRLVKQSFRKSTHRNVESKIFLGKVKSEKARCLIIDDIVTSGSTILTVAKAFPADWEIRACTLARA